MSFRLFLALSLCLPAGGCKGTRQVPSQEPVSAPAHAASAQAPAPESEPPAVVAAHGSTPPSAPGRSGAPGRVTPDTETTLAYALEACSITGLAPTDFATLEVCAEAAAKVPENLKPEALLAQARLFVAFPVAECGASSLPQCAGVREFVSRHPELYTVNGSTVTYTGLHLQELVNAYPDPALLPTGRCMAELLSETSRAWESPACRDYLASARPRPCPEGRDVGKGGGSVPELAGCEVAARRGDGSGPMLVQLGRLCRRFTMGCREGSCDAYIKARPDLFRWYEIHGVQCSGGMFAEVIARWPGSPAADDATWESARWIGGECESFVDCHLERGLRPFEAYRARFASGRNLSLAVDHMVKSLTGNLEAATQGMARGDLTEIKRILRAYEASTAALQPPYRRRVLAALEPYWTSYGDTVHAQELRAEIAGLGAD